MCERYTIIAKKSDLKTRFEVSKTDGFESRYNAAPSQKLPVITSQDPKTISFFHWGLIANLAKNKSISLKLINTTVESFSEKTALKNAVKHRRCLVPADGYYEWKPIGKKTKVPYRVTLSSGELFSFAGLWEEFEDNNGKMVYTFTIITTPANSMVSQIHSRMPVILSREKETLWLDDSISFEDHIQLLMPPDSSKINFYSVSPQVNDITNDNERLIKHAPPADQFGNYTLFG